MTFKIAVLVLLFFSPYVIFNSALGNISFEDVTQRALIKHTGPSFGASWGDYNQDGHIDLWVGNHYNKPSLYLNNKNGTFTDIVDSVWSGEIRDTHGAAWVDIDNDGDLDLLETVGGGSSNFLYFNNNGKFEDRAVQWNVALQGSRSRAPLVADLNYDGRIDIVFTQALGNGNFPIVMTNTGTDFADASEQLGIELVRSISAFLNDLTGDGISDLSILNPSLSGFPGSIYELPNKSSQLNNISDKLRLGSGQVSDVIIADFNNDLKNDLIFVYFGGVVQLKQPNDNSINLATVTLSSQSPVIRFKSNEDIELSIWGGKPNKIFTGSNNSSPPITIHDDLGLGSFTVTLINQHPDVIGTPNFKAGVDNGFFIEQNVQTGEWQITISSSSTQSFNVVLKSKAPITDVATVDLSESSPSRPMYFRNINGLDYENVTSRSGINQGLPCGPGQAADFDNDMDLDVYLICNHATENIPNLILENQGDGSFKILSDAGGAGGSELGRGETAAVADYNNDGYLDVFVTNGEGGEPFNMGPHQLFKNNSTGNNWLKLKLNGIRSNPQGVGARVEISTPDGITQLRENSAGLHGRAQNDQHVHVGLAKNTLVTKVKIRWPSGCIQILRDLTVSQTLPVTETCEQFDHAATTQPSCQLSGCHAGVEEISNAIWQHPLTTNRCEACHAYESWTKRLSPFSHLDTIDSCQRCHASDKKMLHPITESICSSCHFTDKWANITQNFDHDLTTDRCSTCHTNQIKEIKTHPSTLQACDTCHTVVSWVGATLPATPPSLKGLGFLRGTKPHSQALAVSADGQVVVGQSLSARGYEAFRWSGQEGMTGLGFLKDGRYSIALDASTDGKVIVGASVSGKYLQAVRWSADTAISAIATNGDEKHSQANGVSDDGKSIVGWQQTEDTAMKAFKWTVENGFRLIEDDSPHKSSQAIDTNATGSIIAGHLGNPKTSEALVWHENSKPTIVGDLPGSNIFGQVTDISADGSTVVGRGNSLLGAEAFLWSEAAGMIGLGHPTDATLSIAMAVSASGEIVVGTSDFGTMPSAFVWDAVNGSRKLEDVLKAQGVDLGGWKLITATGISADGRTIVGRGVGPDGNTQAYLAVIN